MFYIVNVRPELPEPYYNMRVISTQWCVSSGCTKEQMLETIRKYYSKYRTEENIQILFSTLSDRGRVSHSTFARHKEQYLEQDGGLFQDEINQVIRECKEQNKKKISFRVRGPRATPFTQVGSRKTNRVKPKIISLPRVGE